MELREGQWLAIAGLIQDEQTGAKSGVPFLSDIPYLDFFFSNRTVTRDETELLVLVSPELVHPLEPEEAPLVLPGMEVTEPGNWAEFFVGDYEGKTACEHRGTTFPVDQQHLRERGSTPSARPATSARRIATSRARTGSRSEETSTELSPCVRQGACRGSTRS